MVRGSRLGFRTSLLCLSLLFMNSPLFAVEIIAHRGASYDAPENTLGAFKLGYQQKADADELDIQLTSDGKIVVMHDHNTARTSGITNQIASTSFATLAQTDVGQWGKWKGKTYHEKIPSLDQTLALIPEGKRLFIEIKCGPEILPELENSLKRSGKKPSQTVLIGFGYETMQQAKEKLPDLQAFWLVGADKNKKYPLVDEMIAKAKAARLDGLNLEQGFPMDAAFVSKVHAAGLKLYTWTVDDPAVARRLATVGVDGITTNRPEWLREQLAASL